VSWIRFLQSLKAPLGCPTTHRNVELTGNEHSDAIPHWDFDNNCDPTWEYDFTVLECFSATQGM
jgi:hypothetical protein